jgi:hypothetical protein
MGKGGSWTYMGMEMCEVNCMLGPVSLNARPVPAPCGECRRRLWRRSEPACCSAAFQSMSRVVIRHEAITLTVSDGPVSITSITAATPGVRQHTEQRTEAEL